ncbi:MAG: methylated-DNA--[Clostridia bacterium]|nr:methylated-DNA--[protein]-cysteine S-methyltransferase [Clostridia bacterium]
MNNAFYYNSPLGSLRIEEDSGALVISAFVDDTPETAPTSPVLTEAKAWLDRYFEGRDPGPVPPCDPKGTPFQKAVWTALSAVPYGETRTYGELAVSMGLTARHARAVGGALHRNPLILFIPCHRVLGEGGSLTGFAGGIERKEALLKIEQQHNK